MSAAETRLLAVTIAAGTSWVCRALCQPHAVPFVSPITAGRHLQVLGRQRRLTILAMLLTVAAVVELLVVPARVDPDLQDLRFAAAACTARDNVLQDRPGLQEIAIRDMPPCYVLYPGGIWMVEVRRPDGTQVVAGTVAHPTFTGCSTPGRGVDEPSSVALSFRCP
jgi:hypothetical protein